LEDIGKKIGDHPLEDLAKSGDITHTYEVQNFKSNSFNSWLYTENQI
jgi:hypothetical protein